jgi:hypothetical protein
VYDAQVTMIAASTTGIPANGLDTAEASYLEARWRFCAGLGSRGLFNFGPIGGAAHVAHEADSARDRAQGVRLARAGGAIGLATGVAAVLLPL